MRINELVLIFNEKFNLNKFKIIGLDGNTILFSSKNDGYGITWNILTKDIEFFEHGHKIGYIIDDKNLNRAENVDPDIHQDIIDSLSKEVRRQSEIKRLVEKRIEDKIYSEEYEIVIQLKDFLDIIS